VFAPALLRNAKGVAKSGLPLTRVVKRPDGVEYKRATLPDQGLGGRAYGIPLLPGSAAGQWSIEAYANPKGDSIGRVEFMLQDYVPERLDFTLHLAKPVIAPGEPVEFSLDARFLYGTPASGLDVTGAIRLQVVEGGELAGFPSYVGGLADDDFTAIENQFSDKVQTDDKGHADVSVELPEGVSTRPLRTKLIVDVGEPGGRTVERTLVLPVRSKGVTVGVKKDFDASSSGRRRDVRDDRSRPGWRVHCAQGRVLIALSGDQRLSVVQRRWPLELRARQVVEAYRERHDRPRRRRARQVFRPRQLGRASPRAEDARRRTDERRLRRRLVRNGRRRHPRQCGRDPRQDELHSRRRGEAPLRIASAFTGKATIALVGDKIERFIDVDLVSGDNVVPFAVGADWDPGANAVALTPRPLDVGAKRMPGRTVGIAWFAIDRASHALVSVSGAPIEPDPAVARGYAIERCFYKLDGAKLDALQSMAQNERVVVSLKVTEAQARYARLLVVDRLPAGLEIDNPALVGGGSVEAFSRLSRDVEPAHTEYRDDRFVAAFDRAEGQSAFMTMAYVVRAVVPGRYVYPPTRAEDMYDRPLRPHRLW
jgi:uncharacterized protein YfaS (alpha-2-macroglobulin family)